MKSKAFLVKSDAETHPMKPVKCKNEAKELQDLLEKNWDLLPGEQISPDDPCRWLLIKREMPVHSPDTGGLRWSIDFFFVDHKAKPTFVEVKRFNDTRSRREVIAQMLDYAANAAEYWKARDLEQYARESAENDKNTLEDLIKGLESEHGESVDKFFSLVEDRLTSGEIRLVFFLEDSPYELRSIVEFLNNQMNRTEVIIVEAGIFEKDNVRVVVPNVFGYTEEARRIKKTTTSAKSGRRVWNDSSFFDDVKSRLSSVQQDAIRKLYEWAQTQNLTVRWGTGAQRGSYSLVLPSLVNKSVISVYSDGQMSVNVGWLNENKEILAFRNDLANVFADIYSIQFEEDMNKTFPTISVDEWVEKVDSLIKALSKLFEGC